MHPTNWDNWSRREFGHKIQRNDLDLSSRAGAAEWRSAVGASGVRSHEQTRPHAAREFCLQNPKSLPDFNG